MYRFIKRGCDFIVSLMALPFLLPVLFLIAIAIKMDDGGPVFYKGKRIGKNGKIFSMLKFRSMKVNAPDIRLSDGSTYNSEDDPRVTKIGRVLRKTSLDELPQIINVLIGQMSIVGPRPDSASWLENYTKEERVILSVRPGITGYNQAINRNAVMTKEKLRNDIFYVKNLSLLLDIKIMIMTVKIVFGSTNVYRKSKKLLIIGAGPLQVPAIKTAKDMGLTVAVIDYNENAVGVPLADKFFNCSTINVNESVKVVKEFCPDGVMTMATDMPMRTVAAVSKEYGLKGLSEESAMKATDKYEMIKAFEKQGLPIPNYKLIKDKSDLFETGIEFPLILKPCDNSGSRGVFLVNNLADIESAYEYAKGYSKNGMVLAEEFLIGQEISIESFMTANKVQIIQVTDKLTSGAPHFVEIGHIQPSQFIDKYDLLGIVRGVYSAIGIESGPAHIEVMITENGPKLVEMGARLGGDNISSDLVLLSTGIDLVKATICDCLNEEVDLTQKCDRVSVISYITAPVGRISRIDGIEEANLVAGINKICVDIKVGDKVTEIENSLSRAGYVIACADDKQTAQESCKKAIERITIEVEN